MTNSGTINGSCGCSATKPPDSSCPVGSIDSATCSFSSGWVVDADHAGNDQVMIYRDGAAGAGGTLMATLTTSISRPDITAVYPTHPTAGWNWTTPASLKDGLTHNIYAYGVNVNSSGTPIGFNPLLTGAPRSLTCNDNPSGTFAAFTCGSPNSTATGTATDTQGSPVSIAIYDGPSGSGGVQVGTGTASPNYSVAVPGPTDGQVHQYYAYAKDIPSGTWYQIGTQNIACSPTVQLTANPLIVAYGGSSTLSWLVSNATSCTFNPGNFVFSPLNGSTSGSRSSGAINATTTFNLTCKNAVNTNTSGTATVSVNVTAPTASITSVTDGDYCSSSANLVANWQYNQTALPIGAYQVQVYQPGPAPLFTPVIIYDTGKINTSMTSGSVTTPSGYLNYGGSYQVRAMVWDSSDQASAWSAAASYTAKTGPWPQIDFSINPTPPIAKLPAKFTDTTNYGSFTPLTRVWDFGDGTVITESPGTGTIQHTYNGDITSVTAQLTVTTNVSSPNSCAVQKSISTSQTLPIYKEVRPGVVPSPSTTP